MRAIDGSLDTEAATVVHLDRLVALQRFALPTTMAAQGESGGQGRIFSKTRGMRFEKVRPYNVGDDIRVIDWRVTARTQKTHTKVYRDDNEAHHVIGVDVSSSMRFATQGKFKSVIAAEIAALMGWSMLSHRDKVGLFLYSTGSLSDEGQVYPLASVTSPTPWMQHLRDLVECSNQGLSAKKSESLAKEAHGERFEERVMTSALLRTFDKAWVSQLPRARNYTLITSPESFIQNIKLYKTLAHGRKLCFIFVVDPIERTLPKIGALPIIFGALSSLIFMGASAATVHQRRFEKLKKEVSAWVERHHATCHWVLTTDDPLVAAKQWA